MTHAGAAVAGLGDQADETEIRVVGWVGIQLDGGPDFAEGTVAEPTATPTVALTATSTLSLGPTAAATSTYTPSTTATAAPAPTISLTCIAKPVRSAPLTSTPTVQP